MSTGARFVPILPILAAVAMRSAFPLPGAGQQSAEARLQAAIYKQRVEGDVRGAIATRAPRTARPTPSGGQAAHCPPGKGRMGAKPATSERPSS